MVWAAAINPLTMRKDKRRVALFRAAFRAVANIFLVAIVLASSFRQAQPLVATRSMRSNIVSDVVCDGSDDDVSQARTHEQRIGEAMLKAQVDWWVRFEPDSLACSCGERGEVKAAPPSRLRMKFHDHLAAAA